MALVLPVAMSGTVRLAIGLPCLSEFCAEGGSAGGHRSTIPRSPFWMKESSERVAFAADGMDGIELGPCLVSRIAKRRVVAGNWPMGRGIAMQSVLRSVYLCFSSGPHGAWIS